jgi:hypothetical protein
MGGKKWMRAIDTGLPSPQDILKSGSELPLHDPEIYPLRDRSMAIFVSRLLY